ncbi:hypothetical protein HKBW3S42_01474, partial [Candidatus Hakubella thermalkaliphila]
KYLIFSWFMGDETIMKNYEECEKNLGYDFAVEVYSVIERAVSYPKAWPIIEDEIRRALVKRFPYGILYSEETEEIFTQPTFWR